MGNSFNVREAFSGADYLEDVALLLGANDPKRILFSEEDLIKASTSGLKLYSKQIPEERLRTILKKFAAFSPAVALEMLDHLRVKNSQIMLAEMALEEQPEAPVDIAVDTRKRQEALAWIHGEGLNAIVPRITTSTARSLLEYRVEAFKANGKAFFAKEKNIKDALNAATYSSTIAKLLFPTPGWRTLWGMRFDGFTRNVSKEQLQGILAERSRTSLEIREHIRQRILKPTFIEWLFGTSLARLFDDAELKVIENRTFVLQEDRPVAKPEQAHAPAPAVTVPVKVAPELQTVKDVLVSEAKAASALPGTGSQAKGLSGVANNELVLEATKSTSAPIIDPDESYGVYGLDLPADESFADTSYGGYGLGVPEGDDSFVTDTSGARSSFLNSAALEALGKQFAQADENAPATSTLDRFLADDTSPAAPTADKASPKPRTPVAKDLFGAVSEVAREKNRMEDESSTGSLLLSGVGHKVHEGSPLKQRQEEQRQKALEAAEAQREAIASGALGGMKTGQAPAGSPVTVPSSPAKKA